MSEASPAPETVLEQLLNEGRQAFARQDYRSARTQFSRACLLIPEDVRAQYWMGVSQYHLGHVGEAREYLARAMAAGTPPLPPRPAAVHEYLSRCHIADDTQRALEIGERGLAVDAYDARLRTVLGDACLRLDRHVEALAHYDVASNSQGAAEAFPEQPGRVHFARSTVLARLKRWQAARDAATAAIASDANNAAYHNRLGVILFDGFDDAATAADAVRRAIDLDPRGTTSRGDGLYPYNLALYLEKLGRHAEALEAIDRALAQSPRRRYHKLRERLAAHASPAPEPAPGETTSASLDFSDVGGMKALKQQVRRILDVVHVQRQEAARYGIDRNGILLYGPPGCGKSYFAEAIAGEFDLAFIRVNLGDAISKYVGAAGETMQALFANARAQRPCLLFFDEFDAIAQRRGDLGSGHEQQAVNALLQQIDAARGLPGLVIVAATNRLEEIDPAVIREGRFDYKVKIYRPDFDARRDILQVLLRDRPHDAGLDVTGLAQDMEGFSAAQVRAVVDLAAMAAMEAACPIGAGHLREALRRKVSERRYGGRQLGWDDLVLPAATKRQLQFIERFIENPGLVEQLGIEPPSGALLHGPPGTGKTTIARVLASQTDASFFTVNAADIFSKWLGESEQRVKELFEQARDNVPAILFIDEIDAVLGTRSEGASGAGRATNAVVNTFLAEMDGIASNGRVFVVGATNRPELVDEAVLRPGRLSDVIEIGLPDRPGRQALLRLFADKMRLAEDVDLDAIADEADGASGADLRGLCTAAGRVALLRELDTDTQDPAINAADFAQAIREIFPEDGWRTDRVIGFRNGAA